MVEPETFGAKGDGRTDDTAALQAAFEAAKGSGVRLRPRTYAVRDTLLLPTSTVLDGRGAVLIQTAHDRPILASLAWAGRGPTKGHTRILGLHLRGTGRGERQDGIILYDYWSEIADVEVTDVGGRGIVLTDEDRGGKRPTGTLVENRIRNSVVRNARRSAYWLGKPANGKLTDGELVSCIASLADGAREPAVFLGHAAGWTINGLHTYGGHPRAACAIHQAYFATIANLYIEGFEQAGLDLSGVQTSVAVSNVHMIAERAAEGAAFVTLDGHRDFDRPAAMLNNLGLWYGGAASVSAVRSQGRPVAVMASNVAIGGPGAARVAPGSLPGGAAVPPRAGEPPSEGQPARRIVAWAGRDPQKIEIAARPLGERFEAAFLVVITGRSPDGGLTTSYAGALHWSRLAPGNPATLADLIPVTPPQGFQRGPEVVLEQRHDRVVLLLAFTPVSSGPGQMSVS